MNAFVWLAAFGFCVGWVAQVWKGRLGAFWMLVAMAVVGFGGQWMTGLMADRYDPAEWAQSGIRQPVYIIAHAVPAVLVLLAVTVVPRKRQPEGPKLPTDDRLRRKCPHCAEMILAEARVCPHCGGRVRPILEAEDLPTLPSGPPTPPPPRRTE